MAVSSEVVAISALTRINSLRSTSCVSACSKSADTANRRSSALPRDSPGIACTPTQPFVLTRFP